MRLWCKISGHRWEALLATFSTTDRCSRCGVDKDARWGIRYDYEISCWDDCAANKMSYAASAALVVQLMARYDRNNSILV